MTTDIRMVEAAEVGETWLLPTYETDDGVVVREGQRAYDYYDMEPGTIGEGTKEGWFEFLADSGKRHLLNGERICSMEYARRRQFPGA